MDPTKPLEQSMIPTIIREEEINGQKVARTYCDIALLKRDPQNPKDISDDKYNDLCDFLEKYGQLMPLLVDARPEKLGQLIGGNHSLEGLKEIGRTEAWIEFRIPSSDAEAFMIATLHNQQFSHYLESKLTTQIRLYESEIAAEMEKLEAQITAPANFAELIKAKPNKGLKYEIIIKCDNEDDLVNKMSRLSELGIAAKKRGK